MYEISWQHGVVANIGESSTYQDGESKLVPFRVGRGMAAEVNGMDADRERKVAEQTIGTYASVARVVVLRVPTNVLSSCYLVS
eukprot:7021120-Pyramimonas_sp.AAC.1